MYRVLSAGVEGGHSLGGESSSVEVLWRLVVPGLSGLVTFRSWCLVSFVVHRHVGLSVALVDCGRLGCAVLIVHPRLGVP